MADPFLGEIRIFAGNFAPAGWAFCQGQTLAITQNVALFSLLGTTYGGNGQTTFNLPDLRGRLPIGFGQGTGLQNYVQGQTGGTESVTLTTQELPQHSHEVNVTLQPGTTDTPGGSSAVPAQGGSYGVGDGETWDTSLTGGGLAHPNLQPYLTLNFIIALQGIYPSRS